MKRLDDYSNEELLILKQEEIERLIDFECAHNGVPLLPDPPDKPIVKNPDPDLELYYIEGFCLQNKEDADRVIEIINSMSRMKDEYYNRGYVSDDDLVNFTIKKEFSKHLKNLSKGQRETARKIEENYKELKDAYDRIVQDRKEIINMVNSAITDAREEQNKIIRFKRLYARYLQLAEGEKDIAMNFLKAATNEDDHEYIDKMLLTAVVNDTMLGVKVDPDTSAPMPG